MPYTWYASLNPLAMYALAHVHTRARAHTHTYIQSPASMAELRGPWHVVHLWSTVRGLRLSAA